MSWQAWRRVPEAGACDFCLMLASRGAVYKSQMTATGQRYHGHCRCTGQVESEFERRYDVAIPAEDADKIISVRVNGGYEYTYDLSAGGVRIAKPPKMPRPGAVTTPPQLAAAELVVGAVTRQRLESVRLQLAQLRERLATSTDAARPWIQGRIKELEAEEVRLAAALGT